MAEERKRREIETEIGRIPIENAAADCAGRTTAGATLFVLSYGVGGIGGCFFELSQRTGTAESAVAPGSGKQNKIPDLP